MAEEENAASSSIPPTSTGTEPEPLSQERGTEATDVSAVEHTSEPAKEGVEQVTITETPTTNGDAQHYIEETSDKPTEPQPPAEDTEMKDAEMKDSEEAGDATQPESASAAPASNGTPRLAKRASVVGSSKKKSSAVPEHKSKKLNKKKSKPLTNLNAQPGEYYMARMKGHPPWPSIICDEDMLPQSLLTTRPVTAQLPDGSFKKPEYADGGKRAYERTFPIMFLHTNEFAWIPNTELTELNVMEDAVQTPVEKGKSKTLLLAYAKAAENQNIDHFKTMLAEHQKALQADMEAQEEYEKEKAAKKASKKPRKSEVTVAEDDEMDIDQEAPVEKPKSKKRKKAEDEEDVEEKPAKTPKTATKLKLSTPKTPATESSTKKKAPKSKPKAPKSASEEEAVTPKVEEKPLTPQQAREVKEKKVLYFRHKLQRGFLSRDTPPKEDEMKSMSDFLHELEAYPDLESSIIRTTKIHKVLKAMIKLPSIPLDEEYHFKDRSVALLGKWNEILSADTTGGSGDKDDDGKPDASAAPTTNGEAKSTEEQAKKAKAGEAAAPEEESEAKLENRIGTIVEGEKEAEKPEEKAATPAKTAEEEKTDAPAVDSAPAEAYKPEETVEATA